MVGVRGGIEAGGFQLRDSVGLVGLGFRQALAECRDTLRQLADPGRGVVAASLRLLGLLGGPAQLPRAACRGVILERLAPGIETRLLGAKRRKRVPCLLRARPARWRVAPRPQRVRG